MKTVMMDVTRSSISARDCYPMTATKRAKRDWMKGSNIMLAKLNTGDERHVVCVKFFTGKGDMTAMMDCVTGTLYRDGHCLSSEVLEIVSIDESDHSAGLLAKAGVDWRNRQWS